MSSLQLYGYDLSQPSRAVSWLLRMKAVPFEYISIMVRASKLRIRFQATTLQLIFSANMRIFSPEGEAKVEAAIQSL